MIAWIKNVTRISLGTGILIASCSESPDQPRANTEPTDASTSSSLDERTEVVFGVYTTDTAKDAVEKFRPLLDALENDLSKRKGHQVVLKTNVYGSYEDGLDAIVNGDVDIMRLGPASFILAKKRSDGVSLIAMETYKNSKTFHGIICVHEDSDINSLEDLSERSFAFGDENSTIGRYLSQQILMDHGIHASDLSTYEYLGKHDTVGYMVGAGEFDAGALKESTFKKLKEKGEPIRELARFPNVTKPWVARSGLDESIIVMIRASLLAQDTPEVLAAVGKSGFVVASLQDYTPIEDSIVKNADFEGSDSAFVSTETRSSEG